MTEQKTGSFSIIGSYKTKKTIEKIAQVVFTICAFFAVLAVFSITLCVLRIEPATEQSFVYAKES